MFFCNKEQRSDRCDVDHIVLVLKNLNSFTALIEVFVNFETKSPSTHERISLN